MHRSSSLSTLAPSSAHHTSRTPSLSSLLSTSTHENKRTARVHCSISRILNKFHTTAKGPTTRVRDTSGERLSVARKEGSLMRNSTASSVTLVPGDEAINMSAPKFGALFLAQHYYTPPPRFFSERTDAGVWCLLICDCPVIRRRLLSWVSYTIYRILLATDKLLTHSPTAERHALLCFASA